MIPIQNPAERFLSNPRLKEFPKWVSEGSNLLFEGLWTSPKALLLSLALQATGKHLVIVSGGARESRLLDDLAYFSGQNPLEFPAWENLPSEEVPPSPDIVGERYRILRTLQTAERPQVVVASLQAILQMVLLPERLEALYLPLKRGSEVPFDELPHYLAEMGYHKKSVAADKGEFAVRGGILDLFPVNSPDPFRLEFFGDEIVSIRKYDPISQTSVGKVDEITLTPGEELELLAGEKTLATLFDYLGTNTLLVFDELAMIEDKYVALKGLAGAKTRSFSSLEELLDTQKELQTFYFTETPIREISEVQILERGKNPYSELAPPQKISFEAFTKTLEAKLWNSPFLPLFPSFCPPETPLDDFSTQDFLEVVSQTPDLKALFLCQNESEKTSLQERLSKLPQPFEGEFEKGYLSSGFYLQDPQIALIPTPELTHRYKVRRQKQRTHYHTLPVEMLSLTPGEAVVHMNSGIGRYIGIERRPNHLGVETEFMLLQYAEGSKLYVPMEQANLISKYIGTSEQPPELHTLGSTKWKRARERTEKAIMQYASDLLQVQAERVIKGGTPYPPDSDLMKQFGEEFPYEETPDQLLAIEAIGKDFQSTQSMDRLVCGDVGYGKTEVAMRAAFKTVVDGGKQVAVLVPTTVLALQHYESFSARMENFPLRIAHISRFRKPKEIRETIEAAKKGEIDILIGTHRIVSKDVEFANLGLVVIDEEQRFGVKAKEHLKTLRKEVDCLTLSATPIPRTLYMSLVGARDLSVINTPPEDRLPIQTVVATSAEELVKNALMRELARDGQAYFIHNRVETIFEMADRIRHLLPGARVVVGHGQMSASEIDTVFHAFKSGEADILVATSIIENGIDIPNANTILIDRADRFGLADLYQMRGRVGRWNRKAYCYFLVPNARELSEISRKRLSALSQASGIGGGMKVAMHDLEIRGAGNILGTEQSGHVAAIGFQLYCKLLKKTINALQKKERPLFYHEVKVEFPFDARLPDDYVNETSLRMEFYQRLGDAESQEEIDGLIEEIRDRFGPLPPQVEWLRHFARVRLFAARHHFTHLKLSKIVLFAEQSHGKKGKISQKIPIPIPKTPKEMEEFVLKALQQNFPLHKKPS